MKFFSKNPKKIIDYKEKYAASAVRNFQPVATHSLESQLMVEGSTSN